MCTGTLNTNGVAAPERGTLIGRDVIVAFSATRPVVVQLNGGRQIRRRQGGSVTALGINDTNTNDFTVVSFT